ncbi:MAG TPA: TonB-dependent receptor [Blastocatellia bacterium]|nr:TonB-dependent receptor [Blastocatellia bacterium]
MITGTIYRNRHLLRLLVFMGVAFALCLMTSATTLWAQTETGQIVGTVTDPNGAVIADATVTVKSLTTSAERRTKTLADGTYIVANLLPSVYEVTVEAPGFAKATKRIQVIVGSKVTLDFQLTVGAPVEVVEVLGEAGVLVNTETQTISQVIDSRKVVELPTLTRNPYDLVTLSGNVSQADPTGRGAGFAINGLRAAGTNILLDGAANNDEFVAAVGQAVPLDSVQEFSVLTNNFTAEYGRASAGIVNVVTKSGTNEFHGTVYEFNRVSATTSNSFLNNANGVPKPVFTRNQFGYSIGGPILRDKIFFFQSTEWIRVRSTATRFVVVPTPQLIAAAAPATQNFFRTYGTLKPGVISLRTITRQDLINAGSDPCAPGSLCDRTLGANFPLFTRIAYNRPANSGGGNPQNTMDLVGRVDWTISDKTQLYFRYALEDGELQPGTISDSPYRGFDTGQTTFNNNLLLSLTHTWNTNLVTQHKVVYNRLNTLQPHAEQPSSPTLFFRATTTRFLGDLAALPGYLPFSPGSGIPFGGPQNFGQTYHDINYIRGSHQFRFGGSYVYIQDNRTFGAYQDPSATLGRTIQQAMDNFLRGELFQFQSAIDPQGKFPCRNPAAPDPTCIVTLPVGQPNFSRSNRYHEFAFYAQDSWRMTPRFTLNLGLRWEYFGVQHHKDPRLDSNYYDGGGGNIFQQIRNGDVAIVPNSPIKGLWKKDWNNFAPRIGFAWDLFGTGKTSLRGGYGIGYERNFGNVTFNVIQNPPNYAVISIIAGVDVPTIPITTDVAGPLSGRTGQKALPVVSLRNVDANIVTAYAHLWSLSLEHQVSRTLVVGLDYNGSKGVNLYSLEDPNRPGAGAVYLGDPCTPGNCSVRLRTTQYTNINRRGNRAFSNHNAFNLRVTANNLANTGLTFSANYTWAHTIDNLSSTFSESANNFNLGLLDPFNPRLDRGNSDFDIRHRFVLGAIWDVPFARNTSGVVRRVLHGWTVAPIFSASTGAPFTVFDCTNAQFAVCPRMFVTGPVERKGADNPPADPTTPGTFTYLNLRGKFDSSWVNPITGNSELPPFPRNMTGRNLFRGPGSWILDLGLYKTTNITERFSLQFRAELYNAFNHANAFVLGSEADVSFQDVIRTQKDGRRNVQFALKLIF